MVSVHVTVMDEDTRNIGRERFHHGKAAAFGDAPEHDALLAVQSVGTEALRRAYAELVKPVDSAVPHG